MSHPSLFIDALQYNNWSEEIFKQINQGGLSAVHVTICYHEDFQEMVQNVIDWNRRFEDFSNLIFLGRTAADVVKAQKEGRTAIFFGFQNCSPIEDDIGLVEVCHQLGARFMQLTYNNQSLLGTGCYEENDPGITRMGKQVIKEMNRVGLVVDMSHSAERSTLEAIEISERPIAITHANPTFWHPALRNKSNEVLKALGESGSMLGFSVYPHHLKDGSDCTLESFCNMIADTADIMGVKNIGIGTDLCQNQPDSVVEWMRNGTWTNDRDYGEGSASFAGFPDQPEWFRDNRDFVNIATGLRSVGFSNDDVDLVMGKNWLNFSNPRLNLYNKFMASESVLIDLESDFMRSPEKVMRLDRMGSSFPTRLSFMRTLIRRMSRENWKFERTRREVDKDGYGLSIYSVTTPNRTYSLVGFTQEIPADMRTDRVIAEVWDATFNLFDGVPTQEDIDYLAQNTPKQEGGRYRPSELALARANKSLRVFKNAVDSLSKGQQPDLDLLTSVGYLMRTSAVYGSGKFGCADRAKIADREECKAPFQMELLTVYLIRWFTIDSVEELAKEKGGKKAVKFDQSTRQFIGVGNATGLGMAPFLLKHPALIHNWVVAKETALARVRSIETALPGTLEVFLKSLLQVSQHVDEWSVADEVQSARISRLTDEIQALRMWCENESNIYRPYPWNGIYQYVEDNFSLECQEMIVSLIIEPHGTLVDDLADTMSTTVIPKFQADMTLSHLKEVVADAYKWATTIDFSLEESQHHFWYYSEDKLEPRFGSKGVDDGVDQEMPLAIGRDVHDLNEVLQGIDEDMSIGEFAMMHPQFRHIIRRVQNTFERPYSEVQDNLLSESMRPLDLLRFKLAFFGASKFDPKSDLWTRISMYQGAPMPDQLSEPNHDCWSFPIAGKSQSYPCINCTCRKTV